MSHTLKEINTRRAKLIAEHARLSREAADAQRAVSVCKSRLDDVDRQIKQMQPQSGVQVSEHAIIRYIERATPGVVNLNEIRQFLVEAVEPLVDRLGNGKYPLGRESGLRAVVRDRVIVTVE